MLRIKNRRVWCHDQGHSEDRERIKRGEVRTKGVYRDDTEKIVGGYIEDTDYTE